MPRNDQTIEQRGDRFNVYEFDIYPRSSVLAGQTRKRFLNGFDTERAAMDAYPFAERCHRDAHNTIGHLPGEDDFVPGGAYPDDY